MGRGRRRGRDPRGPRQYAGGAVDGLAELPATVPGSEQGVPVSVCGDVRVGLQRQAGHRGVRAGAAGCAVCHHLPYMSQDLLVVPITIDCEEIPMPETVVHFQVRMPPHLHEQLASWAKEDKASLNMLVVSILEKAMASRTAELAGAGGGASRSSL